MNTYHFVIIAVGLDHEADETLNALYEAGCDDASISWSAGAFTLRFHRDGDRFDEALLSAYRDVTSTGATVTRFEPDSLVTLEDIAERSGVEPSALADLRRSDVGSSFPAPIVRVSTHEPLWDWATVAIWLQKRQLVSRQVAIEARILWEANVTLMLHSTQGANFEDVFQGIATSAA